MTIDMAERRVGAASRRGGAAAWIAVGAAAAVASGIGGYQLLLADHGFPSGTHPVAVYTVVDELTTSGAGGNHLLGMCDADTYYIEVDGAELCVVLNGSLGTVPANGTDDGIVLDPAAVTAVQGMVRQADASGPDRTTQVLLEYKGSPVAVVSAASVAAGGTVTATTLD